MPAPSGTVVLPPISGGARRPSNVPWVILSEYGGDDFGQFAVGGECLVLTAAAALNIGDGVFGSAASKVNKSAVAGNQVLRAGIVVGGVPRSMVSSTLEVQQRIDAAGGDIGLQAAATNDPVLVCIQGVCYAVVDGVVTAWSQLKLSATTAGSLTTATPTTDAGKIIAMALDASSGAGQVIRVIVTVA